VRYSTVLLNFLQPPLEDSTKTTLFISSQYLSSTPTTTKCMHENPSGFGRWSRKGNQLLIHKSFTHAHTPAHQPHSRVSASQLIERLVNGDVHSTQYRLMYATSLAPHPSSGSTSLSTRKNAWWSISTVNNNGYFNLAMRNRLFLQQDWASFPIYEMMIIGDHLRNNKTLVDPQDHAKNHATNSLKNNHCTISHSSHDAPPPPTPHARFGD
jgi:hypothetical protein